MNITIDEFNELKDRDKWDLWDKMDKGKWVCGACSCTLTDNPRRASPFSRASICCGNCDYALTTRTGGGMGDCFGWVLVPKRQSRDRTIIERCKRRDRKLKEWRLKNAKRK